MNLAILTTLICLAHLLAATCPPYRPLTARQKCQTNRDCQSGKSCCGYSGVYVCVSTNSNTCIHKGAIVQKGKSVLLDDNCSTCRCRGYNDFICLNDGCYWPKLSAYASSKCPQYRPLSAKQLCRANNDCPSGKSCCSYFGSNVCVSTDPNTCFHKGNMVKKGKSVLLEDNCSTCECLGYDDFLCLNDGCYWPKVQAKDIAKCPEYRPLTAKKGCQTNSDCPSGKSCCNYSGSKFCVSTNPNTCTYKGKIINKGQSIVLEDNCSTCDCRGYDDLLCTNDGCVWPKQLPIAKCPEYRPLTAKQGCQTNSDCPSGKPCCNYSGSKFCVSTDPNACTFKGKVINKGQSIVLEDNCSTCDCRGHGDLLCTNDGCVWPKQLPKSCIYNGTIREHKSGFPSTDGCNTCFCTNGRVGCTLKACISQRRQIRG